MQRSLNIWRNVGSRKLLSMDVTQTDSSSATVSCNYLLTDINCHLLVAYTMYADGRLNVAANFNNDRDDLPEMPRFGMLFTLPESYSTINWYGRGPEENYADRHDATLIGLYKSTVAGQFHPYIRPQETGNKSDVRWMTLTNDNGFGLKVTGDLPLNVTALNYASEDLDPGFTKKQQHPSEVVPQHEIFLSVDLFQRGIGGLNTWGAQPMPEYRYKVKPYSYSFTLSVVH